MANEIEIIVSIKDLASRTLQSAKKKLSDFGRAANENAKKAEAFRKKLEGIGKAGKAVAIGAGIVTGALLLIGKAALKSAGDFEQHLVAFETMLGSAEEAKKLLGEIERFSASTPFQLPTLVKGAKRLLAFGITADDVVQKMRNLGNAAQGNSERLDRLTLAYGKLRAKGKATMEEINMFTEAGVPLLDELSKQFGVTTKEIFKMIETGKVGFPQVDKALTSLTTGAGMFAGLIEKQALTFNGLVSTMGDNIGLLAKDIGDVLLPVMKPIVLGITNLVKKFREASPATKKFITILGVATAVFAGLATVFGGFLALLPLVIGGLTTLGITLNVALVSVFAITAGLTALVGVFLLVANAMAPIEKKTQALIEKQSTLTDKTRGLKTAMKELEEQGKKNSSQYIKLQRELRRVEKQMAKNAEKIDNNIDKMEKENQKLDENIAKQKERIAQIKEGGVSENEEKDLIKQFEKLEEMEERKLELLATSKEAREILKDEEAIRDLEREQTVADKQIALEQAKEKALVDRLKREKKFLNAWFAEKAKFNEADAKNFETWQKFIVQAVTSKNKEVANIAKAVAIYDITIKSFQAAMGAYNALVGIPLIGPIIAPIAAASALAFGNEQIQAVSAQQPALEEGGIVPATPGGRSVTVGEGGQDEAIIPLTDAGLGDTGDQGDPLIIQLDGVELAKVFIPAYKRGRKTGQVSAINGGG